MNLRKSWQTGMFGLMMLGAAVPARAQELMAWPIGMPPSNLRFIMPGLVHPPIPRPIPQPQPRPIPQPRPPRPLPRPEVVPMTLSGYNVEGSVQGRTAHLILNITFHNPNPQRLEGVLVLPIPADTVMSGFSMTVGGKKMSAELLEADKAGAIYQSIVNQVRDPALLELVGERLMRARVFPIEPNGDVSVRVELSQILRADGGLLTLSVPLKSAKFLQGTSNGARVRLQMNMEEPLRTLYASLPEAKIERKDPRHASVSYDATEASDDLRIFYSFHENPMGAGILTFKESGEDGFFMVSLSPKMPANDQAVTPKDVVFIFDRSGSMAENEKMEQARKALQYCIRRLYAQDRFGIVDFATDSAQFDNHLVQATEANKTRALRYVSRLEPAGGTNIEEALQNGLALLKRRDGRIPMVFFMTDGLPSVGNTNINDLIRQASQKAGDVRARVFTFGVGSDVNTLFLDKLAENGRGAHDYALPGENLENKLSVMVQKVSKPALTDVRVEWKGIDASQVYPRPITDIFYGSEVTLMGRYPKSGRGTLAVSGRAAGKPVRFEFPVDFTKDNSANSFLPRLWANLKVSHELDAVRLSGRTDPEVIADIVKLAKRYGIVTPYTSYLITEEGQDMRVAQNVMTRRAQVMHEAAAGSGAPLQVQTMNAPHSPEMTFSGLGGAVGKRLDAAADAFRASRYLAAAKTAPASAPASGLSALHSSEMKVREELESRGQRVVAMRQIAGKTFYQRAGVWVDADYEMLDESARSHAIEIRYLSQEYFDLLNKEPGIARYLSVGSNVTVVFQGKTYRIVE